MRQWWGILIFAGIIALPSSVWAQGQATITEGWASNVVPPGTYATPFVPQLVTPNISFETYSANPVGATNATSGNVAGAANATAENGRGSTGSVVTVPVWYGPGAQVSPAAASRVRPRVQPLMRAVALLILAAPATNFERWPRARPWPKGI